MCRINRKITDEDKSRIAEKNWRVTSTKPSFISEICGWLVKWLIGRKFRESDVIKTNFVNPMARFDANEKYAISSMVSLGMNFIAISKGKININELRICNMIKNKKSLDILKFPFRRRTASLNLQTGNISTSI
jgi:hypothetical protein